MVKVITFCPTNQIVCETNERGTEYSYFWPDSKFTMQSTRITKEAGIGHSGGSLQTVTQIFSQKIVKMKSNVESICPVCPGLAMSHTYVPNPSIKFCGQKKKKILLPDEGSATCKQWYYT